MVRKFECMDCGKSFSFDDKEQAKCPHCGSDNVDYATIHIPYKRIGIIAIVLLVVFLLVKIDFGAILPSFSSSDEETVQMADSIPSDVEESRTREELENEIADLGIEVPPTIKGIDKMELDDDGNYNVAIKIEHAPEKGYNVVLIDVKTDKVVAKSDNGNFKGVPYSKHEGKYYAQIVKASSDEALSERTEITGFIEVKSISKKLSVNELQDLISKQDPSLLGHDNEYLSPIYQIKYENLPKNYEAPDNLADVFEMLDMEVWTSVEVTSLEYDDTKHISLIKLRVKMPSRPDFGD